MQIATTAMHFSTVLFFALLGLLPANACNERFSFAVRPSHVYVGQNVSFVCSINASATLKVSDWQNSFASCDIVSQPEMSGMFTNSPSCFKEAGRHLHTFVIATTDIGKRNFTCHAKVLNGSIESESCTSDSISISVSDIPKLLLTPQDMTLNDSQRVTIRCSTNMSKPETNVTLSVIHNSVRNSATSLNFVEITINASRDFHEAEVLCEAPQVPQILAEKKTLQVNYIYTKNRSVGYHSVNRGQALDCSEQVESYPGAQYEWFLENSSTDVKQPVYTCEAPPWCNASLTCVATNIVTLAKSTITFKYEGKLRDTNKHSEPSPIDTKGTSLDGTANHSEDLSQNENVAIIVVAALCGGALVTGAIVAVLVRKRLCCTRATEAIGTPSLLPQNSRSGKRREISTSRGSCKQLCFKKKDCVINMTDNELYETMPVLRRLPSEHAEDCLVLASDTVDVNLKQKVGNNSYLVLFSDHCSTLKDIQGKIEETVPTKNSIKKVAFLLRRANKGLVLSLADNLNIDGDSVTSDQRLQSFLKHLVESYMDKSSKQLRLDLLNFKDAETSKGRKMANQLARLLDICVVLSSDMYGIATAIDNNSCVADVYFNRQRIDDPVIYTDLDLSKDCRKIPAESQEKVEYSEIVRPALRPPLPNRR